MRRSTIEAAVPSIRCISVETAKREGYRPITNEVCPRLETAIFLSIQSTLQSCDAVWIECAKGRFMAARKASDLLEVELLVSADARRGREGV
jgi:hypothetical protein